MITAKKNAIKYKDADGNMKDSGVLCQVSALGEDLWQYVTNLGFTFYGATFPDDYTLRVNVPLDSDGVIEGGYCFNRSFSNSNAKKIILKGNVNSVVLRATHTFENVKAEEIDISEFNFIVDRLTNTFVGATYLRVIKGELDLSLCEGVINGFSYMYALEEISFKPESIPLSVSFAQCSKLSDASIQNIIDGLMDLTDSDAQTVTFHSNVVTKLTEEQIAQIEAKNWVVG